MRTRLGTRIPETKGDLIKVLRGKLRAIQKEQREIGGLADVGMLSKVSNLQGRATAIREMIELVESMHPWIIS